MAKEPFLHSFVQALKSLQLCVIQGFTNFDDLYADFEYERRAVFISHPPCQ